MGNSGKWMRSLMGLKKEDPDKVSGKGKKWKLWRSSSADSWSGFKGSPRSVSDGSDAFSAAVATVVRAKDFKVVRQEWAAIRIQTAFRAFLARRALRALKAVVRIQALVRGRQVRKQAAMTLRCMQALVRVQARVRARRVRMSMEGQAVQKMLEEHRIKDDLLKEAEQGWCDKKGTLQDVKSKLQMRQEGALKRERALAYALAQKQWRSNPNSDSQTNVSLYSSFKNQDKNSSGWSWLERWMAAKPWETRLMEQSQADPSEKTPPSKCYASSPAAATHSKSFEPSYVRKNNVSKRVSARPPHILQVATRSSSSPSSEYRYGESPSSSSMCTSATPFSGYTALPSERTEGSSSSGKPNYMSLTESIKAKRRGSSSMQTRVQRQSMDEFQFLQRSGAFSNGDSKNSTGSNPFVNFSRPL